MRSRAVRVTLTLLAVVAIGAAAYFHWTGQARISGIAEAARAAGQARAAAAHHAFELRLSQQAYVAAGQNEAFWFERVTTEIHALRSALPALKASTTSSAAHAALDEALLALEEFEERDRRVRNYASSGQKLLASDVIFSDGLEAVSRIVSALEQAGDATEQTKTAAIAAASREQVMATGAAAGFAILSMLLLTPLRPVSTAPGSEMTANAVEAPGDMESFDLHPPVRAEAQVTPAMPVAPAPEPAMEIQSIAQVCTDLARLEDTSTMPAILERTAAALDASGLVLWVIDPDGKELMPVAAYGYPTSALSRMGTLPVDARNATAAAFRTGLLQTVSADGRSNGAIAAPFVSPAGCLGVMSAEVRHEGEKHPARLAAASIIAAQLATLVGPPAARAEGRSTATL